MGLSGSPTCVLSQNGHCLVFGFSKFILNRLYLLHVSSLTIWRMSNSATLVLQYKGDSSLSFWFGIWLSIDSFSLVSIACKLGIGAGEWFLWSVGREVKKKGRVAKKTRGKRFFYFYLVFKRVVGGEGGGRNINVGAPLELSKG